MSFSLPATSNLDRRGEALPLFERDGTVAVGRVFGLGSAVDPPGKSGCAHLAEHVWMSAFDAISMENRQSRLIGIGANFNAYTGREMSCAYAIVAVEDYARAVDILSDQDLEFSEHCYKNDIYGPSGVLREIEAEGHGVRRWARSALDQYVLGLVGRAPIGDPSEIRAITPGDVRDYLSLVPVNRGGDSSEFRTISSVIQHDEDVFAMARLSGVATISRIFGAAHALTQVARNQIRPLLASVPSDPLGPPPGFQVRHEGLSRAGILSFDFNGFIFDGISEIASIIRTALRNVIEAPDDVIRLAQLKLGRETVVSYVYPHARCVSQFRSIALGEEWTPTTLSEKVVSADPDDVRNYANELMNESLAIANGQRGICHAELIA